ncbi:hypothetical protein [Kineosporia sp. A_224]|jgi:hypothetical protein|uniref:hypothetical protein n=1 Tax=Kineosporia sp. A_224 TaxID=1962180 RepID=UPI0013047210|nr:hypothetical protein [Kineosporia sp. A_224]
MAHDSWTLDELHEELKRYEAELRATTMTDSTVQTYVDRPKRFLSWLAGEYKPGH